MALPTRQLLFKKASHLFEPIRVSRQSIHKLPAGTLLVYDHNLDSDPDGGTYDEVEGIHHGHISILRGQDEQGNMLVGSDHLGSLDTDLALMHHTVTTFILKKHGKAT